MQPLKVIQEREHYLKKIKDGSFSPNNFIHYLRFSFLGFWHVRIVKFEEFVRLEKSWNYFSNDFPLKVYPKKRKLSRI